MTLKQYLAYLGTVIALSALLGFFIGGLPYLVARRSSSRPFLSTASSASATNFSYGLDAPRPEGLGAIPALSGYGRRSTSVATRATSRKLKPSPSSLAHPYLWSTGVQTQAISVAPPKREK